MSRDDPAGDAGLLTSLTRLPEKEDAPVFEEPWQAQAFALAVRLSEQGYFTWTEWSEALGEQLGTAESDDGSGYYEHWLAALEQLVTDKKLTDTDQLVDRKEAWRDAYHHTPHGQPVKLRAEAGSETE
ncbi:MAG: nitrile hydratase accessory protein [Gammaproteobacteria bacterium]